MFSILPIWSFALHFRVRKILKPVQDDSLKCFYGLPRPRSSGCLGFPSRSALTLVWLRQYSLRASLPGVSPVRGHYLQTNVYSFVCFLVVTPFFRLRYSSAEKEGKSAAMTHDFSLPFLVIARERNRTGTPCETKSSPVPLRGETTLFPSVRFQDSGATKQSSQPASHVFTVHTPCHAEAIIQERHYYRLCSASYHLEVYAILLACKILKPVQDDSLGVSMDCRAAHYRRQKSFSRIATRRRKAHNASHP